MGKRDDILKGVDPNFKRKIKAEASLAGMTIKQFTAQLVQPEQMIGEKKKKGGMFDFKI